MINNDNNPSTLPLQYDIRTAGRLLGYKSDEACYTNLPGMFQVIRSGKHIRVPASQLCNALKCSHQELWEAAQRLEQAEVAAKPERDAAKAAEAAAREKLRLAAIDQLVDNMPAVKAAERAAAKAAA